MFYEGVEHWFGLNKNIASAWGQAVDGPFKLYPKLARMVNTERLPHILAYESAITKIYHEEMRLASFSRIGRDPSAAALLSAKRRVGAPFPQGEARFKIEALLDSIKLRPKLIPTAKKFSSFFRPTITSVAFEALTRSGKTDVCNRDVTADNFMRMTWAILSSCRRDILIALNLCHNAEARRLEFTALVLSLQVDFDFHRFGAESYISQIGGLTQGVFESLAHDCRQIREGSANQAFNSYYRIESIMVNNIQTLNWAKDTILPVMNQILQEWSDFIALTVLGGTFYAPVSAEEKMMIVQAVVQANYGVGGRFYQVSHNTGTYRALNLMYQCPNGHSFTIGDVSLNSASLSDVFTLTRA